MRVKLLKKCRSVIVVINIYDRPIEPNDKKIMVARKNGNGYDKFINSWGGVYYTPETAIVKRRKEILLLAKEISTKTWYKLCTLLR